MISITLRMSQAGNSVTVSGSDIVVNRTGATETLANLVTAINAPGSAAIPFIKASAVGVGSLGAVSKTYLVGGAGEQVSAQIGGAPATIREQGDTSMLVDVLGTALTAAGVATGDVALVNLLLDYQRLSASLVVA
jgi:hypothetical protein